MKENLKKIESEELLQKLGVAIRTCTKAGLIGGDATELRIMQDKLYGEVLRRLNLIPELEDSIENLGYEIGHMGEN